MNKVEVLKLAKECGMHMVPHGVSTNRTKAAVVTTETLLAFANACEKIGMEKAAKICDEYYSVEGIAQKCAEVIRKAI